MAKTGLFFGSFNPIHNGHLIVAQYMINSGNFDKIRFVVSPQNPFKSDSDLMDEKFRLALVKMAIESNAFFDCSDVEFSLPKPSYTIQTLNYFLETEPENIFSIIMGSDNLEKIHLWKDIDTIAKNCDFHVYKRRGSEEFKPLSNLNYKLYDAPFLDISATHIRELMKNSKSTRYLVPDNVFRLLNSVF